MSDSIYEGSHRKLFKAFLRLVDDSDAQLDALLNSTTWKDTRSLLSIGGGKGIIEAALLANAPEASIWYLDPSKEQCQAFRQYMKTENLGNRVKGVEQATFQDFQTDQTFDRIVSIFSWFYVGADERWLTKLLDLLTPDGTAILLLPNKESIETIFYKAFSPDKRMSLVGDEVVNAMKNLKCNVSQDTYIKWLVREELFEGGQLSDGSLALAAFAAEKAYDSFTANDKEQVSKLLIESLQEQGVPMSWDLILVTRNIRELGNVRK